MNKNWNITFFNENVKNETLSLPDGILANLLRIFDMVKEVGAKNGPNRTVMSIQIGQ